MKGMDKVRIIEVKENILNNNDKEAARLREELHSKKTFLMTSAFKF